VLQHALYSMLASAESRVFFVTVRAGMAYREMKMTKV